MKNHVYLFWGSRVGSCIVHCESRYDPEDTCHQSELVNRSVA
jgi:hypothetical protein